MKCIIIFEKLMKRRQMSMVEDVFLEIEKEFQSQFSLISHSITFHQRKLKSWKIFLEELNQQKKNNNGSCVNKKKVNFFRYCFFYFYQNALKTERISV